MREREDLGLNALVGRSVRYAAQYEDRWLALLGWASAALKCAPRDACIGGSVPLLAAVATDGQQQPIFAAAEGQG